jgi:hypothetical protein
MDVCLIDTLGSITGADTDALDVSKSGSVKAGQLQSDQSRELEKNHETRRSGEVK